MAHATKEESARCMLRSRPAAWFRDCPIEQRDLDLIKAKDVPWVNYNQASYLRKIYHMKAGESFKQTNWIVETDVKCKALVQSAGAKLYGFNIESSPPTHWASVTVNVNISGTFGSGFDWGCLSTRPENMRIFKGPQETCSAHPWDAMILRDCTSNTDTLGNIESISSRKWDILCMKMCEDYDHPWAVIAVRDGGPVPELTSGTCSCQDPSACGCIIVR